MGLRKKKVLYADVRDDENQTPGVPSINVPGFDGLTPAAPKAQAAPTSSGGFGESETPSTGGSMPSLTGTIGNGYTGTGQDINSQIAAMKASGDLPMNFNYNFEDDDAEAMANNEIYHAAARRAKAKAAQTAALNAQQAPKLSPQMEARLKALEGESQAGPLVSDPYFQADRAALVTGGQEALARVQNRQAATGATGGFSNQGSISDIYDRLGAQMAELGQRSADLKAKKADSVAQMRQDQTNAEIAYANAIEQARAAIEAGDMASAQAAMQYAIQVKSAAEKASRDFWGSIAGGVLRAGGAVAGAAIGGPAGAAAGGGVGGVIDDFINGDSSANLASTPFGVDYGGFAPTTSTPWSLLRKK